MDKQNIPHMTPEKSAVMVPYCDITVSDEVSEEISLADYYPEVRRIVSVSARVIRRKVHVRGIRSSATERFLLL